MIDDEDFEDDFYEDFDDDIDDAPQSADVAGLASSPIVKIGAVILVAGALTLGYLMMPEDNSDDSKIVLRVGDKTNVTYVPGQEKLDPAFKKALEESNKQDAIRAEKTGGSALPAPIGTNKESTSADAMRINNNSDQDTLDAWRKSARQKRRGVRSMKGGNYGSGETDCVPDLDQCMDLLKKSGMLADLCKEHLKEMGLLDEMCKSHLAEKGMLGDMKVAQCKKLLGDSGLVGPDGKIIDGALFNDNKNMTDGSDVLGGAGDASDLANRKGAIGYDADGNRTMLKDGDTIRDANGNALLDANGNEIIYKDGEFLRDKDGNLVFGADGNVVRGADDEFLRDKDGNLILDENGNPIRLRNGKVVSNDDGLGSSGLSAEELARLAEIARLEELAKQGGLSPEELARLAELKRLAELARLEELAKQGGLSAEELARLAELKRLAELARQAELARLAALENDGLGQNGLGGAAGLGQDGLGGYGQDAMVSFVDPNKADSGVVGAGGTSPEQIQMLTEQMAAILQTKIPEEMKQIIITAKESPYQEMLKEQVEMEKAMALQMAKGGSAAAAASSGDVYVDTGPSEEEIAQQVIAAPGDIVYAQILTAVNSDVPGTVLAQILTGPFTGGKAIGSFSLADESLVLSFETIIKDDISYPIEAVALDRETSLPGLADDVDHHYITRVVLPFAAKFLEGYSAAIAETGTTTETDDSGTDTTEDPEPDHKESLYAGFEEASGVIVDEIDSRATPPVTVKINRGTTFGLLFTSKVTVGNAM